MEEFLNDLGKLYNFSVNIESATGFVKVQTKEDEKKIKNIIGMALCMITDIDAYGLIEFID